MEKLFQTIVLATFIGVILKIVAYRLKIPAIVPLLFGGIIFGPYGFGLIDPGNLGSGLPLIISVCIGVILFEGGLSLDLHGFKSSSRVIGRLLTVGILATWIGTAVLAKLVLGVSYGLAFLLGSLIIVTGPSVITPILQRIEVKQNLKHILNWEAVLIDPIGVFIAILCFELMTIEGTLTSHLLDFSFRFFTGAVLGLAAGIILYRVVRHKIIPPNYNIIFTFAFMLFIYLISNTISHESGLLTVVVAGFTFAVRNPQGIKHIQHFKFELSELALSVLFVLLAANLELENFIHLTGVQILFIVLAAFIVRPINVFLSAYNSEINLKEKLFLSWIAPRGIVAASIASLFTLELSRQGYENADFVETFVYAIIILTVVFQGGTAEILARLLNLKKDKTPMWLIVGANRFSRNLALNIEKNSKIKCHLIDTNHKFVHIAHKKGLSATHNDASLPEEVSPEILSSLQKLVVLTDNEELNKEICEAWANYLKKDELFYWGLNGNKKGKSGKAIWGYLPKPSNMSFELKDKKNELTISGNENGSAHLHYHEHLLLTIDSQKSKVQII